MKLFSKFLLGIVAAILIFAWPNGTKAWVHGIAPAQGKAVLNLGLNEVFPENFINVFKTGAITYNTPSDASLADATGYLVGTPSNSVGISFPSASNGPAWTGVSYKLNWPATITFKITFNSTITGCSAVNATVTGCSGSSTTITSTGGAGSVTFTNTAAQFSMFFPSGFTYAHSAGELALYRVSDEPAYQAGKYYTPEFVSVVSALRPRAIRTMGMTQRGSSNFNGETQWICRVTPQDFAWRAGKICPPLYGGAITGTDTYAVAAGSGSPTDWTDGEIIQGVVASANTSTTPTLSITGHTGAKTIVRADASAIHVGDFATNSLGTFVYDSVLDKVLFAQGANAGGIVGSIPIEAQVGLANQVGANIWSVIPPMANNDYVTNWAAIVLSNLRSDLLFYPEYTNELWNNAFVQTPWAAARGLAFGFPNANNEPSHGWYGIRVRQIMGDLIPAVWSGSLARLHRTLMWQGGGTANQISTYRLKGADLAPSGTSTGQGNALYCTYTGGTWNGSSCSGGANYTTKPNRPIDVVEEGGYGPYVTGTNLCFGPDQSNGCTLNNNMTPFYQALVTAWEAGQTATAIAAIDNDVRQGLQLIQTVTASGTTFTTPLAHGFTAGSSNIAFTVTGGTSYSGLVSGVLYRVLTTPTASTFTIAAWANGVPGATPINAGSAGTGIVSVGISPFASMLWMANNWYPLWEGLAASFDSDRPSGMNALSMTLYEGNLEPKGLSTAQCTTLGITSSQDCGTDIANALLAWKNDVSSAATTTAYFTQFMGTDATMGATFGLMAHSEAPSWLILECASDYQLLSSCGPSSTPYQTYYGFQSFSVNWLLRRDLDPASNDNDPMFLGKAA